MGDQGIGCVCASDYCAQTFDELRYLETGDRVLF